jgi:hypothetical protein
MLWHLVAGSWQGTCGTCMNQYGANNCNAMLAPKFNAARDDLMSTGFTPAQVQWPLQVRVTHVAGPEFNPMLICTPPAPGMAPRLVMSSVDLCVF